MMIIFIIIIINIIIIVLTFLFQQSFNGRGRIINKKNNILQRKLPEKLRKFK